MPAFGKRDPGDCRTSNTPAGDLHRLGQVSVLMRLHGQIEMEGRGGLFAGFGDHGVDGAKSLI